jgi:hypothetical protein
VQQLSHILRLWIYKPSKYFPLALLGHHWLRLIQPSRRERSTDLMTPNRRHPSMNYMESQNLTNSIVFAYSFFQSGGPKTLIWDFFLLYLLVKSSFILYLHILPCYSFSCPLVLYSKNPSGEMIRFGWILRNWAKEAI